MGRCFQYNYNFAQLASQQVSFCLGLGAGGTLSLFWVAALSVQAKDSQGDMRPRPTSAQGHSDGQVWDGILGEPAGWGQLPLVFLLVFFSRGWVPLLFALLQLSPASQQARSWVHAQPPALPKGFVHRHPFCLTLCPGLAPARWLCLWRDWLPSPFLHFPRAPQPRSPEHSLLTVPSRRQSCGFSDRERDLHIFYSIFP